MTQRPVALVVDDEDDIRGLLTDLLQASVAAMQPFAPYGSTSAPVVPPVAVVQRVLLPQPTTNVGHIWRGGVFIPIPSR